MRVNAVAVDLAVAKSPAPPPPIPIHRHQRRVNAFWTARSHCTPVPFRIWLAATCGPISLGTRPALPSPRLYVSDSDTRTIVCYLMTIRVCTTRENAVIVESEPGVFHQKAPPSASLVTFNYSISPSGALTYVFYSFVWMDGACAWYGRRFACAFSMAADGDVVLCGGGNRCPCPWVPRFVSYSSIPCCGRRCSLSLLA